MLKLSDVLGGSFVACQAADLPAEFELATVHAPVVIEPVVTTGAAVAPWELARREAEGIVQPQIEPTPEPLVASPVQAPWLQQAQAMAHKEAAAESQPQVQPAATTAVETPAQTATDTLAQSLAAISTIPAPPAHVANEFPEGWSVGSPVDDAKEEQFRSQEDRADWVLAKGRALPFSTETHNRDPFNVGKMYDMIDGQIMSDVLGREVTSFRTACRHAIAKSIQFYEQDVQEMKDLLSAKESIRESEDEEAARQDWKQMVEARKTAVAEWDRKVTEARDRWHALRKVAK